MIPETAMHDGHLDDQMVSLVLAARTGPPCARVMVMPVAYKL